MKDYLVSLCVTINDERPIDIRSIWVETLDEARDLVDKYKKRAFEKNVKTFDGIICTDISGNMKIVESHIYYPQRKK